MNHEPWLDQAEDDLDAARTLSGAGKHSQAVWLAAQAVEKAHKAILISLGLQFQEKHFKSMGHNIASVQALLPLPLLEPFDADVAKVATLLETRGMASRYPAPDNKDGSLSVWGPAPRQVIRDSQQDIEDATRLLEWCKARIGRAQRGVAAMGAP